MSRPTRRVGMALCKKLERLLQVLLLDGEVAVPCHAARLPAQRSLAFRVKLLGFTGAARVPNNHAIGLSLNPDLKPESETTT